jgi:ribonuclease P protein component
MMAAAEEQGRRTDPAETAETDRSTDFPRSRRLTKPSDFKKVFEKPLVSSDHCFKVLARVNDKPRSRLGLAVSRKVERTAVARNRIKRIARESFRQYPDQPGDVSLDFVVLPRLTCGRHSNTQLFESLQRHWRRLHSKAVLTDA